MVEASAPSGRAALTVGLGPGGRTVVTDLHGTGALAFRPTPWGVWLVGTAAHPIGGDRLLAEVDVGAGCRLEVRSLAATVARRGAPSRRSVATVAARVGLGATLCWAVEPGVAAAGADHTGAADVELAGGRLWWFDEFVVGRAGEQPGTWRSRLRVALDGVPILASEVAAGPDAAGWASEAVLAGARAVAALTVVDPGGQLHAAAAAWGRRPSASVVTLPVDGPGVQITAWGDHLWACRELVATAAAALPGLDWAPAGAPPWA